MILKFNCVTKQYKDIVALDSFDIEMKEGIYALLGPNGAGKSTLMNTLAGLIKATSGNITLDGEDIISLGNHYRDILGYLPQTPGFYPSFTAEDIMFYFSELKGIKKPKERVEELLKLVNLWDDKKKKYGSFSGGMKRRLGIAVSILNDPRILILDEPTAGLDPKERIRFRNIISNISRDKIVIIATHIVSDVENIADKVLLLKNGRLIKCDNPTSIIETLRGKVWVHNCDVSFADEYVNKYNNAIAYKTNKGTALRIVSGEKPFEESEQVEPSLEDVYVYYFDEG